MSDILIISGTNRPESNALRISRLVLEQYEAIGVAARVFSLADLPKEAFDGATYASKPPSIVAIQQAVLAARGLHVVTPEYNGSFPGVLKYFIDLLKFPESFENKPVAFIGEAAGIWGGLRAVEQLQQIFSYRNAHLFPDRVFIPGVGRALNPEGRLIDPALNERIATQCSGFSGFVELIESK
jgi:chromate reductase, NAD(P)H dehydrogenase (quinone)